MPLRPGVPARDQDTTGFTRILQNLVEALPGLAGVALVDELGECVDYAGVLEPFEIRLTSAHLQIELRHATERLSGALGGLRELAVYARKRTFFAVHLVDGYDLILVFTAGSPWPLSSRAIAQAEYDIRVEGGWDPTADLERWIHLVVDARPHDRWRPHRVRLAGEWHEVEVMGTVVGLAEGERGFRVRTRTGAEMTLVRERFGHWYADVRY